MSQAYIINSMGQSPDWLFNSIQLVEELKRKWKGIEIIENVPGSYVLQWAIEIDGRFLLGGFQSDYQTLTIDGGAVVNIAEFVIWYRTFVPEQCPLFLWKGSKFDHPIKLSRIMSKEELAEIIMCY